MPDQKPMHDTFSALFGETRKRLIKGVAAGLGGKAQDAVRLSPDDEVAEYSRPTSPAAQLVLRRGGSLDEAYRANAMWANQLKQEQATIKQAGQQAGQAPEEIAAQLAQAGRTDDQILKECMAQAWELARANGQDDERTKVDYHERMLKRIAARQQRPADETLPGTEG
jgi:hypothetical protein